MTQILVDSNVILDIFFDDPHWALWSEQQLTELGHDNQLCINSMIYTELSMGFNRIEELEEAILLAEFKMLGIPREALFLAGKAFLEYRRNKGTKSSLLPAFFIGAHAAISDIALITRDVRRYQTYFPTVNLIFPST